MKRMLAAVLPLLILCGCAPRAYSTDFFAMNTFMSVEVHGKDAQALAGQCETRVNELERMLSRTQQGSAVYQLNDSGQAEILTTAAAYLQEAAALSDWTSGCFDPTVAALTDLWGIGTDSARVPAQGEITQALRHVGAENIEFGELDASERWNVRLKNGVQLDLGGIAKGIAADACVASLRDAKAEGLLQLGGNIYAVGENRGKPWVIGIADPDNNADYIATVAVRDLSVVTSGDYERFFEQNGTRYHHIFDPRTGYPADSGLRSVTVIDENSTRADALSTALFVMGLRQGMAFCAEQDIAAVFITADKQVHTTEKVAAICAFTLTGAEKGYTYAQ